MRYSRNAGWAYIDFDELEQATGRRLSDISLALGHGHDWLSGARRNGKPILLKDIRNIQGLYGYTPFVLSQAKKYPLKRVRRKKDDVPCVDEQEVEQTKSDGFLDMVSANIETYLERQAPPNAYDEQHIVNAILTAVRIMLTGSIE
jgi:hypothetical protein